jgi:hypothetical protein
MGTDTTDLTRRSVNLGLLSAALAATGGFRAPAAPIRLFDFAIAGGWHHGLYERIGDVVGGAALRVEREPDNPYDSSAVAIWLDRTKLGYVPRCANAAVARLLDAGESLAVEVVGALDCHKSADVPDDLEFTSFRTGDPRLRLRRA